MKKVSSDELRKSIRMLSLQDSYDSEEYPSSVARMIFSHKKEHLKVIIKYFLENTNQDKMFLKYFVRFVRNERDRLFPNDYRKSNQKFISVFGAHRRTKMEDYIKSIGIQQ